MASSERFGFEWNKYSVIDPLYESQLKNWVSPLSPEFFAGKSVLDAGCGMGRNSYWPLKWGAGHVTAFDFDQRSVAAAQRTLSSFPQAEVSFGSIYEITWREQFDIAMCIGVLHHLEHPRRALENLTAALKPGGTLVVWVYSYEGNEWIVKYVDPIRKSITSRLPLPLVHILSYFCSVPLYVLVKLFHGPTPYLRQLSTFKFWHVHSIVFDQLIPTVANYWKKEEVEQLVGGLNLVSVTVQQPPNKSGWTIIGKK